MYFSRVYLDVKKKATMLAMHSPAELHRSVASCFPDMGNNQRPRHLWALDKYHGQQILLILSEEQPDFRDFVRDYGMVGKDAETKEYDSVKDKLSVGMKLRFRAKVNPVRYLCHNGKWHRCAHVTPEYQLAWFAEQGAKHGFSVVSAGVNERRMERFQKNRNAKSVITLSTCVIDGVLQVTDVTAFWNLLCFGLGQGKAYGCGLVLIG